MSKQKTLLQKYKAIQKIGCSVEVPWAAMRVLHGESKTLDVWGDQVSLGEDFVSLQEAREAIQFYAEQLGGLILWDEEK